MSEFIKEVCRVEDGFSSDLLKTIHKIIENEKYTSHTIHKRKISTGGANYLSVLYEVDIEGETSNGYKETNIFVKQNLSESEDNILSPGHMLLNEIFVYIDLANVYNELQREANIPDEQKYNFIRCYTDDDNVNALILDNMTKKGYKVYSRLDIMPLKAMELSVRELAKFHALSIALEVKQPDFFKTNIATIVNPYKNNNGIINVMHSMCHLNKKYLDENNKKKIDNFLPVMLDNFFRYSNADGSNIKCLCHGDYRMLNILVKEIDNEIVDVIPIDYQIIYYGNPLIDLIFLLFMSTDQQFRKDNMEPLKNMYFESLANFLNYFNISLESIYSRRDFERDFNEVLDYGLMVTFMGLPLLFVVEEEVPDIKNQICHFNVHDGFKKRLEETIEEFTNWGYL